MTELTLEGKIEKIIIEEIRVFLDNLFTELEITSATKLGDLGIDILDTETLHPTIIEKLVAAGFVSAGFKFKDAPENPIRILDFNTYHTVGDLVKQVLEEIKMTSNQSVED